MTLILVCLCVPMNFSIQAEDVTVDYEALFKKAMDEIKESYLYGDEISEKALFEAAMKGMFDSLDPYSEFQTPVENQNFTNAVNQTFVGIGVQLNRENDITTITKVLENSPAQKAGVLRGDYFKVVDGIDVTKMAVEDLLKKVLGVAGTSVKITFGRGATSYSVTIKRAQVILPSVNMTPLSELYTGLKEDVGNQIGYVSISSFSETAAEAFEVVVQTLKANGAKYLILDLRNNGGGYVDSAVELARSIIPAGTIVSFRDNKGRVTNLFSETTVVPFQIVALVNEYSASASEFVAGAIQDSGVGIIVGETTYGKGVAQHLYTFEQDYSIKLTQEEFFTRNGKKVNGIGITPDYSVEIPEFIPEDTKYYLYDQAKEINNLEKVLNYLGYNVGTSDELYDKKTFDSVKEFQIDQGLYGYGVCDFTTLARLNEALQKSVWEKDPQLNKAVELILDRLN